MMIGKLILAMLAVLLWSARSLPSQERAVVSLLDGTQVAGLLAGVSAGGGLRVLTPNGTREIPAANILSLSLAVGTTVTPKAGVRVELASGDVLAGIVDDGRLDLISLTCPSVGSVRLQLDDIRRVTMLEAVTPSMVIPGHVPTDDEIYLAAGDRLDRVRGEVVLLDRSSVVIDTASAKGRKFRFRRDGVVAILLAPLEKYKPPDGILAVARFRDGSRVTGTLISALGGALGMKMVSGTRVTLGLRLLARIDFKNPAFVSLCDLKPSSSQEVPFLPGGRLHGVIKDVGFRGEPRLRIGEQSFFRGFGMHARTVLRFTLDGAYSRLQAVAGIDPHTRDRALPGSVRMKILVDGRERWKSPLLVSGSAARQVAVADLTGARTLTLVVDFGESCAVGARGIFADPVLFK
jgi:hypothetical protein